MVCKLFAFVLFGYTFKVLFSLFGMVKRSADKGLNSLTQGVLGLFELIRISV